MRLYLFEMASLPDGTPVPAYLIQTDDGTSVLVDTGFPERMVDAPPPPEASFPFRIGKEHFVLNRLTALGVAPDDVRYLIVTHLDLDHAGALDRFPNAGLAIQRTALDAARSGVPRYQRTRDQWDDPARRWHVVDGDTTLLPGIELIESGGHAPGHQAVLVRLPETGPVLLAVDAIASDPKGVSPEEQPDVPVHHDQAAARRSARKLVDLAEREGVALTIHGHDAEQWRTLRKPPSFYD